MAPRAREPDRPIGVSQCPASEKVIERFMRGITTIRIGAPFDRGSAPTLQGGLLARPDVEQLRERLPHLRRRQFRRPFVRFGAE